MVKGIEATYKDFTRRTAKYPKRREKEYLMLGLMNEAGEVGGAFKKEIRDHVDNTVLIIDEMGDVLWYLTRLCDVYDIKIRNNKREKILTFFLSDNIKNATENTSQLIVNGIVKLHFYFTKKDDPHMLRKHVSVNVEDIFQNNVITNYTETLNNVSVFTKRIYENYLYEEV